MEERSNSFLLSKDYLRNDTEGDILDVSLIPTNIVLKETKMGKKSMKNFYRRFNLKVPDSES